MQGDVLEYLKLSHVPLLRLGNPVGRQPHPVSTVIVRIVED